MTHDTIELLNRALTLPEEERAELAGFLLESLDGPHDDPEAVEAAWKKEIARRIEDLDSGSFGQTCSWQLNPSSFLMKPAQNSNRLLIGT